MDPNHHHYHHHHHHHQEKARMKDLKQPYMLVDGGRQITVRDASDEPKPFAFDHCFDSRDTRDAGASQAEVFESIGKKVSPR
jgi:hypothetical protein